MVRQGKTRGQAPQNPIFLNRISNHHKKNPHIFFILCAFKGYVEYLYRHIFLVTCTSIQVTKKNLHTESSTFIIHTSMPNETPLKLVCSFPKPLAVIRVNQIH